MAIKRFGSYETTKSYGEYQQLPKGGYILNILGAKAFDSNYGQYVKIQCDIAEGEFAGYYRKIYDAKTSEDKKWPCNYILNVPKDDGSEKDGWTAREFKTVIEALEDSNDGYHFDWDERKFKGKKIGGLFNIREYEKNDGSVGSATNLAKLRSVDLIRGGKFKLPADKLLNKPKQEVSEGFTSDIDDDELPFD